MVTGAAAVAAIATEGTTPLAWTTATEITVAKAAGKGYTTSK